MLIIGRINYLNDNVSYKYQGRYCCNKDITRGEIVITMLRSLEKLVNTVPILL